MKKFPSNNVTLSGDSLHLLRYLLVTHGAEPLKHAESDLGWKEDRVIDSLAILLTKLHMRENNFGEFRLL